MIQVSLCKYSQVTLIQVDAKANHHLENKFVSHSVRGKKNHYNQNFLSTNIEAQITD